MSIGLRAISAALCLVALIFGYTSVTAVGTNCGSVLGGASAQSRFEPLCADKRSSRQPLVWGLLGAGAILGIAGFRTREKKDARADYL